MKRILIVNPFGIGDVLFTTPLIRNIKSALPSAFIGYVCNERTQDLLSTNPFVNKVFVFEKDRYRKLSWTSKASFAGEMFVFFNTLRRCKFDTAIDLSLSRQYGFFLFLLGIKNRIGYNYKKRGIFLTRGFKTNGYNEKHIVEYYLELLHLIGLEPKYRDLELFLSKDDEDWARRFLGRNSLDGRNLIGLIPGGGASWGGEAAWKRWPAQNFARLADEISELKERIILIMGSDEEKPLCAQVETSMHQARFNICGGATLRQFAALVKRCELVICNDGGPLHIAVSLGIPTISIFGPVSEKVYGPYPPSEKHLTVSANVSCRPCYRNFRFVRCRDRECLSKLSVEEVFGRVEKNGVSSIFSKL